MRLAELLTDPVAQKLSAARAAGLLATLGGVGLAFAHPSQTATVAAVLGYAALALGLRQKGAAPDA